MPNRDRRAKPLIVLRTFSSEAAATSDADQLMHYVRYLAVPVHVAPSLSGCQTALQGTDAAFSTANDGMRQKARSRSARVTTRQRELPPNMTGSARIDPDGRDVAGNGSSQWPLLRHSHDREGRPNTGHLVRRHEFLRQLLNRGRRQPRGRAVQTPTRHSLVACA